MAHTVVYLTCLRIAGGGAVACGRGEQRQLVRGAQQRVGVATGSGGYDGGAQGGQGTRVHRSV
jgi:hypothetical protein